jgi:Tol biopolymer transport system component
MRTDSPPLLRGLGRPILLACALAVVTSLIGTPARAQSPLDKVNAALKKARENQVKAKAASDSTKALVKDATASGEATGPGGGSTPAAARPQPVATAAAGGRGDAPAPPAASSATRTGTEKIEEQLVAPNEQDMRYYLSPKGAHLAAITQKGSRFVVVHDGQDGPKFDEILNNGAGGFVNFSPDGKRLGYGGRLGQEYVVMVDGKEVGRGPMPGAGQQLAFSGVLFSPNSQHWLYHYDILGRRVGDPPPRWYCDGVAGPVGAERNIVVSPDGNRHAYIATNPAKPDQWALVVDGKPAPYLGSDPQFSADGKHLFTTRVIPVAVGRPAMELLLDGRPMLRAEGARLFLPPAGDQVIVQVLRSDPTGGPPTSFLVIGGKKVEGSAIQGGDYGPIWFSADGKHYAARSGYLPKQALLIDGKRTPDYSSIDSVWFTDAGTVVYTARAGAKRFTVTGDQESEGGSEMVQLGRGNRVGYTSGDQGGNVVVVDGKVTRIPGRGDVGNFSFSPDGTRFAYFQGPLGGGGGSVVIDNAVQAKSSLSPFGEFQKGWPTRYIWSPDSKYTVHYGSPGNAGYTGEFGFIVGDRYLSQGKQQNIMAPTFTPDGRHLFWLVVAGQRSMIELWLDGRMIYEFDDQGLAPLRNPGSWEMGTDGVLTFIIQTVDGFKRVRVTPGPENGFEAFLAQGKVVRP